MEGFFVTVGSGDREDSARETIFMPTASFDMAGMKRCLVPFFRLTMVR